MYKKNGFSKIKRIKKFVNRSDIRKFLAPLHYEEIATYQNTLRSRIYAIYCKERLII